VVYCFLETVEEQSRSGDGLEFSWQQVEANELHKNQRPTLPSMDALRRHTIAFMGRQAKMLP
jgi:hypothetical protein